MARGGHPHRGRARRLEHLVQGVVADRPAAQALVNGMSEESTAAVAAEDTKAAPATTPSPATAESDERCSMTTEWRSRLRTATLAAAMGVAALPAPTAAQTTGPATCPAVSANLAERATRPTGRSTRCSSPRARRSSSSRRPGSAPAPPAARSSRRAEKQPRVRQRPDPLTLARPTPLPECAATRRSTAEPRKKTIAGARRPHGPGRAPVRDRDFARSEG